MRLPISNAVLFLILCGTIVCAQSANQAAPLSGLDILQQAGRRYAQAKSYRIEAIEESTTSSDLQRSWQKTLLTAAEEANGRYRYEGHSAFGSAARISDGTTIWTYHFEENSYTKRSISAQKLTVFPMSEMPAWRAQNLRKELAELATHYNSAERLPDTVLEINGRDIPCYVVRATSKDMKRSLPNQSAEKTFWIDKTQGTLLRSLDDKHSYLAAGPARIPLRDEVKMTYTAVELDEPIVESLFTFTPSPDAKLFENFPDTRGSGGGVSLLGRTVPDLQLKSPDGRIISMDSFRGKPVLLDVWATWCGPCVQSLQQLAAIYQETKDKGLVFLTFDTDEESKTAADFLNKRGYTWPNFHDDGAASDALSVTGVPRTLLIDAKGKVVLDKIGVADNDLRSEIAKLGPEFASVAPKPEPVPCGTLSRN